MDPYVRPRLLVFKLWPGSEVHWCLYVTLSTALGILIHLFRGFLCPRKLVFVTQGLERSGEPGVKNASLRPPTSSLIAVRWLYLQGLVHLGGHLFYLYLLYRRLGWLVPRAGAVHLCGRLVPQRLMRPPMVVVLKPLPHPVAKGLHRGVFLQIDILVLHAAP